MICNSWSAIEKTVLLFLEARIVGCDAEGAVVLNIEHWPRRARCSQFLVAINLASSKSLVRRACSKLTRRVRIPPLNRIDCTALHRVNGKSSSVSQSTTDELHRCSSNGGIIRYRPQLRVRRRAAASLFHFVKLVYRPQKRTSLPVMLVARPFAACWQFPDRRICFTFVGSIFRPAPPLGVVGLRDTPAGNTSRSFYR